MFESSDTQSLLRGSLHANAAFSLLSGLTMLAMAEPIAVMLGVTDPHFVLSTGVNLLVFAPLLVVLASRALIPLRLAWVVVGLDLAWVVGSGVLAAQGVLTRTGNITVLAVADVVLVFAILQTLGIRRARRTVAPA